jgi:acetolactate synthase-1/2/3 large subunit
MVRFQEMAKYGRASGVDFGPIDVVPFAEAFGAHGLRIDRPEQIAPTLRESSRCRDRWLSVYLWTTGTTTS